MAAMQRVAGALLMETLRDAFMPGDEASESSDGSAREALWRVRFEAAYERLHEAGLKVTEDRSRAADRYVVLRAEWDGLLCSVAAYMAYGMAQIDPFGSDPGAARVHRPFAARRHDLR